MADIRHKSQYQLGHLSLKHESLLERCEGCPVPYDVKIHVGD
jgi:hypothetical protein